MIRRILLTATSPFVALVAVVVGGPVVDRVAHRLTHAPRRLPEEAGMAAALDALGGEVVRLRARDGVRLTARWLAAEHPSGEATWTSTDWQPDPHEAVLVLHGYSGSVTPDLLDLAPFLRRTAGVMGLDFRGHGGSDDGLTTFGLHEIEDVAGALAWLGERGITRVALVGSSMGGITALAAVAVLGDGRLEAVDAEPDAPAAPGPPPRPRIVAVVADSVTPELSRAVGAGMGMPLGRVVAERAFAKVARAVGGDPRDTQPIRVIGLLEDLPLLLIHGDADRVVPPRDARRLAVAAPAGTRHVVIAGAGHGAGHATDPAAYERAVTDLLRAAFAAGRE